MVVQKYSPTGNRTLVVRVTGGNTHHYTIEEMCKIELSLLYFNISATVLIIQLLCTAEALITTPIVPPVDIQLLVITSLSGV